MTEQLLLALKAVFVIVLYLFVWRVIRLSVRDLRGPQESMVLGAAEAARAGLGTAAPAPAAAADPRLVVLSSPIYPPGTLVRLRRDVTFGREADNDVVLDGDSYVSGHHTRVVVRDGARYVEDLGSTNGTHVGGHALVAEHRLRVGDEVRVGETELRYEE
ncbi:MAG TPA: FHA domain-containing protein [Gaiellales bacterium]